MTEERATTHLHQSFCTVLQGPRWQFVCQCCQARCCCFLGIREGIFQAPGQQEAEVAAAAGQGAAGRTHSMGVGGALVLKVG